MWKERNGTGRTMLGRKEKVPVVQPSSSLPGMNKFRNSRRLNQLKDDGSFLPTAEVGEAELENIVKVGQGGENAKALVGDGSDTSGGLLSDYKGLDAARMVRTPRTAPQRRYHWKQNTSFDINLFIFNRRQHHDGGQKSA
jgi:hypothetical protein